MGGGQALIFSLLMWLFSLLIPVAARVAHELGTLLAAKALGVRIEARRWMFAVSLDPGASRWRRSLAGLGGAPSAYLFLVLVTFVALALDPPVVTPEGPVEVGEVRAGSPAEEAGVQRGDVIAAVEGEAITSFEQLVARNGRRAGQPTRFTIERGGERLELEITPADEGGRGIIGVLPRTAPIDAAEMVRWALTYPAELVILQGVGLADMLSGRAGGTIVGPVGMGQMVAQSSRRVPAFVVLMMPLTYAMLFLLLHLLPIPFTTGGRLLLPWLRRRG
jgi:regulator of sigma E protease